MTVSQAIQRWHEARGRADNRTSGVAAAKQIAAIYRATWDIANAPCGSPAGFVEKLRFARYDVADRGIVDVVVLRLLDGLIGDAARLAGAAPSDDDVAAADERTILDVRRLMRRGISGRKG